MKNVHFSQLKRIVVPKGDVLHGLKSSDNDFFSFGEAYFTTIDYGKVKGWKLHRQMIMNLIVPLGDVLFHIYDNSKENYQKFRINRDNYGRLTVPAGYWMAFEGKGTGDNLILNIASIEHNPYESVTLPLEDMPYE